MNARLPLAFVVLLARELPGRGCSVVQPRCSELGTTEIDASRWSRASPEVARGRPRREDRWRAAWPAFPASSGGLWSSVPEVYGSDNIVNPGEKYSQLRDLDTIEGKAATFCHRCDCPRLQLHPAVQGNSTLSPPLKRTAVDYTTRI